MGPRAEPRPVPPSTGAGTPDGPRHVGIIMDGNGRWAAERGLPRIEGHRRGMDALRETVRLAPDLGIDYLTVFSFSSENWSRPADEVQFLFGLLRLFIQSDLAELHDSGVRIRVLGARRGLPADICALLDEAQRLTAGNSRLHLQVAFNYGGREEIVRAAKALASLAAAGAIDPAEVDADLFAAQLDTAGLPDPDLIIRTSGEMRISNFLLWQAAYAELVFLPIFWPDFDRRAFAGALAEYRGRTRRFGGLVAGQGA